MEGEFTFKPFGKCLAADAVDLDETFARRPDHIIDTAGEGAEQPAPRAFREAGGNLDGAIRCLGEFDLRTFGVAGVRILRDMNEDDTLLAGMDFHRAAYVTQIKPCRGCDREGLFHNFRHSKLLFF